MGYPRHFFVPPTTPGTYHCVSRCVRRAFLCGEDVLTGQSYEHRRRWLEERILELARVFAVAIHGYAVMSNHFHLIVETDPNAPSQWSDEQVATRWLALSTKAGDADKPLAPRIAQLTENTQRINELRQRLGSLSWFMKYLKEPIARRANREDQCKGCFWESRFASQALLDDPAIVSSMVYVDLNPIRAGMAQTPETSAHTSVCARSQSAAHSDDVGNDKPMAPLAASIQSALTVVTTTQYLELVDWTGRALHPGKTGVIDTDAPPIIRRLGLQPTQWCLQVPAIERHYARAIGQFETLMDAATAAGCRWLRGIGFAARLRKIIITH